MRMQSEWKHGVIYKNGIIFKIIREILYYCVYGMGVLRLVVVPCRVQYNI